MKIQILEYFITLAESHSINEAAKKLYVSQPSLTKALQLFEKEIGVQLFVRKKSGIQLTEAGEKILPEAKQMIKYYNEWLGLGKQQPLKEVNIYIQASFPNCILPEAVMQFKKQHPSIQIHCEISSTPEQYISQDTEQPALVLFVCGEENHAGKYVKVQGNPPETLLKGEWCCLVNRHSSLAEKEAVTPEDLKNYYLAFKSHPDHPPAAFVPILHRIFSTVPSSQIIQMESVESIIGLVQSDPDVYALSYYPLLKRYEGIRNGELVYVPFKGSYTKGDFCLFYSKQAYSQQPVLQELVQALKKEVQRFSDAVKPLSIQPAASDILSHQ